MRRTAASRWARSGRHPAPRWLISPRLAVRLQGSVLGVFYGYLAFSLCAPLQAEGVLHESVVLDASP